MNNLSLITETYFDGADVGVLCCVLVLIKAILGELSLPQIDAELDEQKHHRLEGCDRTVSGPFGDDMLVEKGQRCLRLSDSDELLRPLYSGKSALQKSNLDDHLVESLHVIEEERRFRRARQGMTTCLELVLRSRVRWRRHAGQLCVTRSITKTSSACLSEIGRQNKRW